MQALLLPPDAAGRARTAVARAAGPGQRGQPATPRGPVHAVHHGSQGVLAGLALGHLHDTHRHKHSRQKIEVRFETSVPGRHGPRIPYLNVVHVDFPQVRRVLEGDASRVLAPEQVPRPDEPDGPGHHAEHDEQRQHHADGHTHVRGVVPEAAGRGDVLVRGRVEHDGLRERGRAEVVAGLHYALVVSVLLQAGQYHRRGLGVVLERLAAGGLLAEENPATTLRLDNRFIDSPRNLNQDRCGT